ncbi:MAG: hypothetical protein ACUVV5_09420 [Candidatus Aminicenantales bacterium]
MRNKLLREFILVTIVTVALLFPLRAKEKLVQSTWDSGAVIIDASAEEWSDETLSSEEVPPVDLAIRNDANNLYLLFVIRDNDFLSTLEATGMTVFLDPQGRKKRDHGLRFFRRKVNAEEFIQILEGWGQTLSEEQKSEIRSKPRYLLYDCEIFEKKKTLPLESLRAEGLELPTFCYVKQMERTVFEFRIPLSRGIGPGRIQAAAEKTFKIGFEWGGLTREMQEARLARAVAAAEKGVEREIASEDHARGSEMVGFTTSGGSSGLSRTGPKKYSLWVDVILASAPE